jgi:hypothetical protein
LLIGGVVVGAAGIVLGIAHMAVPVFKWPLTGTEGDCAANGLRVPCVADRFGLGGGLLAGGAALVTTSGVLLKFLF